MLDINDMPGPEWWRAIQWFNDGDPAVMAELVLEGKPMPLMVREFLAEVVIGKRTPGRADKARKLLNTDHKERLRRYASTIHTFYREAPPALRRAIKEQVIAEVVQLSGAAPGTVQQAWKAINARWAQLDRRNHKLLRKLKADRDAQVNRRRTRELSLRNDPFARAK